MSRRVRVLLIALIGFAPAAAVFAQTKDVRVYASVLDADGHPVTGLTAADFTVREDNTTREVLSVAPATEPLTIAFLIDNTQASSGATQMIREGARNFVKALSGKAEIAIITFGDRPTIAQDYTTDEKRLLDAVGRIFAQPGAGAYFDDAVMEVSRGLQKREPARPVIAALLVEDPHEFSNRYYQPILDQLAKSGAALHVLAFGTPSGSETDELRNRNQVLALGTERTGGRRDQLLAATAIPGALTQLADELAHQYVVTYARPETLIPPEKLAVSVKRPGVTVRARTQAPPAK
ncbi:MAG TPA: VWA domain-containing protein [Vicinamibacterales bacterium]|jgi:VWFA-related protein|nr:VWA domain-containing protein [Vicinamibacterales bacterium]